jgi:hypothetical protein
MVLDALQDTSLSGHGYQITILIVVMYKAQTYFYQLELDAMVCDGRMTTAQRRQVTIRTADAVQGHVADLVFVDFVRNDGPGFTDDRRRLCVALTRAQLAGVVVMSRGVFVDFQLFTKPWKPTGQDWSLLGKIYQHVAERGGVVTTARPATLKTDTCKACANCGGSHDQKDCGKPLKCGDCGKIGHGSNFCPWGEAERDKVLSLPY